MSFLIFLMIAASLWLLSGLFLKKKRRREVLRDDEIELCRSFSKSPPPGCVIPLEDPAMMPRQQAVPRQQPAFSPVEEFHQEIAA